MSEIIKLTLAEILLGAQNGIMRMVDNMKNDRQTTYGNNDMQNWQQHVEGSLSEMALAKYKGVFYAPNLGKMGHQPDVGKEDVRATPYRNGHLLLHPEDDDSRVFWLLIGKQGRYEVVGWMLAGDGKLQEYWGDLQKGWFAFNVPRHKVTNLV